MNKYNKLVRDKVPEIIAAKGEPYKMHIATRDEYIAKLKDKLIEEAKEFNDSSTPEELADLLEVIYALAFTIDITRDDLEHLRHKKMIDKGGFSKGIILEES